MSGQKSPDELLKEIDDRKAAADKIAADAAALSARSAADAKKKKLQVLDDPDGFLALVKLHNRFENMIRRLSDIQGGLRTLGDRADQASVSRIRRAADEILSDLLAGVDNLIDLTACLGVENGASKAFIAELQMKLHQEIGGRRPRPRHSQKSSKSSD